METSETTRDRRTFVNSPYRTDDSGVTTLSAGPLAVGHVGLEPTTHGLKVRCSTN